MKYLIPDGLDASDIEWLTRLISNSLVKSKDPTSALLFDNHTHIAHWNEALTGLEPYKETVSTADPKPIKKTIKKTKTKRRIKVEDDPFKCPDHKTYNGQRACSRECERCWDIYKTRNGIEQYKHARRKFELRQRRIANG